MKITQIECIPVSLPFAKPMIMSGGGRGVGARRGAQASHTDEGVTGISESGDTSIVVYGRKPGIHFP